MTPIIYVHIVRMWFVLLPLVVLSVGIVLWT